MKKIKFGMIFDAPKNYKGGINYFRNFSFALSKINKEVEIILFVPNNFNKNLLKEFGLKFKIVKLSILQPYSLLWFIDKILLEIFNSSVLKHIILKGFSVDTVFTFSKLKKSKYFKLIFWLPDLQFMHFPNFFSRPQIQSNKKLIEYMLAESDVFILSSNTAKQDLKCLVGIKSQKARVLQFVSQPNFRNKKQLKTLKYLKNKYNFSKPYFFLPNQFWKHKNHLGVFEAIRILRSDDFIVICSGETLDHRDVKNEHFRMLKNFIKKNNLQDKIKILGLIPYSDVLSFFYHSIAIINPSFFEGWSSSVEEAKGMHKNILLSKINVHLEQNPENGYYFDPKNSKELSNLICAVFKNKKSKKSKFSVEKETVIFGKKINELLI